MLKADFHLHTGADEFDTVRYSPKELIDRMAELGYNVMAITHHERLFYDKELEDYAKKNGIVLIPGAEYNIEGKHVVVLNTTVKEVKTFAELRELKKREDVYVIAPHPYYPKRTSLLSKLRKNIDVFDAIEYAHLYLKGFNFLNNMAANVARKHSLPMIGNSDCHKLSQLDNTYTLVDSEPDKDAVIKALRSRKFEIRTKPLKLKTFLSMGMKSIMNMFNEH